MFSAKAGELVKLHPATNEITVGGCATENVPCLGVASEYVCCCYLFLLINTTNPLIEQHHHNVRRRQLSPLHLYKMSMVAIGNGVWI
jgi:hypothetical protein